MSIFICILKDWIFVLIFVDVYEGFRSWVLCPQRQEEGIGSPSVGVADGSETPDMGTGNKTPVFLGALLSNPTSLSWWPIYVYDFMYVYKL